MSEQDSKRGERQSDSVPLTPRESGATKRVLPKLSKSGEILKSEESVGRNLPKISPDADPYKKTELSLSATLPRATVSKGNEKEGAGKPVLPSLSGLSSENVLSKSKHTAIRPLGRTDIEKLAEDSASDENGRGMANGSRVVLTEASHERPTTKDNVSGNLATSETLSRKTATPENRAQSPKEALRKRTPINASDGGDVSHRNAGDSDANWEDSLDEVLAKLEQNAQFADSQKTLYSKPMTSISKSENPVKAAADDIHLEKDLDLPEYLTNLIVNYDDELSRCAEDEGRRACQIHLAVARLLEHEAFEQPAYVRYKAALKRFPGSVTAVKELRRIAMAYGRNEKVIESYKAEAECNISDSRKARCYEFVARYLRFDHSRATEAEQFLNLAYRLAPRKISLSLMRVLMQAGNKDWTTCAQSILHLAKLSTDPGYSAGFYLQAGIIYEHCLSDLTAALQCYEQAFKQRKECRNALSFYASAAMRMSRHDLALDAFSEHAAVSKPSMRIWSYIIACGVLSSDGLHNREDAIEYLRKAFEYDKDDILSLELLHDIYMDRPEESFAELEDIYAELAERAGDPRERVSYTILRSESLMHYAKSPAPATKVLQEGLAKNPTSRRILDKLRECLMAQGYFEDSLKLAQQAAEQSDPIQAADRFADLGNFCLSKSQLHDRAVEYFERALALNPSHRLSFNTLEPLYREKKRYADLVRLCERRIQVTNHPARLASLYRTIATLYETELEQPQLALDAWKQYRFIYPDDLDALVCMQRLCRRLAQWTLLVELLDFERSITDDPIEISSLWEEMADLCEQVLGRRKQAINFFQRSLESNPRNIRPYRRLRELLRLETEWKALVELLKKMPDIFDSTEHSGIYGEIGSIYESKLLNDEDAILYYYKALEADPYNHEVIEKLENNFVRQAKWDDYCALMLRRSELAYTPKHRASLLFRVAIVMEAHFNRTDDTQRLLERAQSILPNYPPVHIFLKYVYSYTEQWKTLCNMLSQAISIEDDVITRAAMSFELAVIRHRRLKDYQSAVQPYELCLALDPTMSAARGMLCELLIEMQQFNDIGALLYEQATHCHDKKLALSYCKDAISIVKEADGNTHGPEVSLALNHMMKLDEDNITAIERLESLESQRKNLLPYWEKRIKTAEGDEDLELRLSMSEVLISADPLHSFELLRDAVEIDHFHLPAVRMAANAAIHLNNDVLAARYREAEARCLHNIDTKIIAWQEAAKIVKDRLKRLDSAAKYLYEAFKLAPYRSDLCDNLLETLASTGQFHEMIEALDVHIASVPDDQKVKALMYSAQICTKFDTVLALSKLKRLLDIRPDNVPALEMVAKIESEAEHWTEAVLAYRTLIEHCDAKNIREYRIKLAQILGNKMARKTEAIELLEEQLSDGENNSDGKNDDEVLGILARMYHAEGLLDKSLDRYQKLKACQQGFERASTQILIEDILRNTNRLEEAKDEIREIGTLDDIRILLLLKEWMTKSEDYKLCIEILESIIEKPKISQEFLVKAYGMLVEIYSGPLKMRFDADRFALAAAQKCPQSHEAQLLAASVFDPKEALNHAMVAVQLDPLSVPAYRKLGEAATKNSLSDLAARVDQIRLAFEDMQRTHAQAAWTLANTNIHSSAVLTRDNLLSVAYELMPITLVDLLHAATQKAQIFALPPLRTRMLQSNDRAAQSIFALCKLFHQQNVEILVSDNIHAAYSFVPDRPNAFALSERLFHDASDNEIRFHAARALAHLTLGTSLIHILDSNDFMRIFRGLFGIVHLNYGENEVVERLESFLSRKERKTVIEIVRSVNPDELQIDYDAWFTGIELTTRRIALAVSMDMESAAVGLLRESMFDGFQKSTARSVGIKQLPYISDLLLFNIGDKINEFRKLFVYLGN